MEKVNPYAPPQQTYANGAVLAKRYRADYTRLPLREFFRVSGSNLLSVPVWLLARCKILKFQEVFDAPVPLLSDLCPQTQIPDECNDALTQFRQEALGLGFTGEYYSMKWADGSTVKGCALRMIHQSGNSFLTTIYTSYGSRHMQVTQITSRFKSLTGLSTYSTMNDRQRFDLQANCRAIYCQGASLTKLQAVHETQLAKEPSPPMKIADIADVACVVDAVVTQFHERMIAMGVFEPV